MADDHAFKSSQRKQRLGLHYGKPAQQQGVALFVGLIMLLLLTILATTGMQTTSLEEKMAGNMRDRNLAFQAAESALVAGENYLNGLTTAGLAAYACDKKKGLYPCGGVADPVWEEIDWTKKENDRESEEYTEILSNIGANPRYIIEDVGCMEGKAPPCTAGEHYFRITARATGGSTEAVVMLQSIFAL